MRTGNLESTGNLDVAGSGRIDSSLVVGDTMKAQDIEVSGNAKIAGDINIGGGMFFKNGTGISVTSGTTTGTEIYSYGKSAIGASPTLNPCINPNPPFTAHQFGGVFQIYDNGPSGYTGGSILTMQSWNNGSSMDVAGGGGLLMNYFCGKDIFMCTGTNGGSVFAGDIFRASKNVQIGNPGPSPIDANVSLNLFLNGTTSGLKLWSGAIPTVKLIHDNYDQFMVMGNGKTSIGVNATPGATPYKTLTVNGDASFANYGGTDGENAFEILGNNQIPTRRGVSLDNNSNVTFYLNPTSTTGSFKFKNGLLPTYDLMELDVYGKLALTSYSTDAIVVKNFGENKIKFKTKSNGQTCIGCDNAGTFMLAVEGKIGAREIKVTAVTPWPDFVFEKNYKLIPLLTVDEYIKSNKHLPGIPSANELENETYGLDIAKMQGLQMEKIEDIYLYLIDLKKEIEVLKKENAKLKKQNDK